MIENLFFMNGFGLYVWSAFTFTLVSFLTLFLVIEDICLTSLLANEIFTPLFL